METTNLIVITISIVVFIWYRRKTRLNYGLQSSISKAADYYQKDKRIIFTFIFVNASLAFPYMYLLRDSFIGIIAAMLISGIAGFTGYNPELKPRKLQDTLHVIFTICPMVGYCIGLILLNKYFAIPVIVWLIYTTIVWVRKTYHHTRKIEELGYYISMGCFIALEIFKL